MASPLTGSLAAQIFKSMSFLFLDATFLRDEVQETGSPDAVDFDPPDFATTEYACKAIVETYSAMMRAEGQVRADERKVLILANSLSVTPRANDRITIRGITFTIQEVETDPALAVWTCRGRF